MSHYAVIIVKLFYFVEVANHLHEERLRSLLRILLKLELIKLLLRQEKLNSLLNGLGCIPCHIYVFESLMLWLSEIHELG